MGKRAKRKRKRTRGPAEQEVVQHQATPIAQSATSNTGKPLATSVAQPATSTAMKPLAPSAAHPVMLKTGKPLVVPETTTITGVLELLKLMREERAFYQNERDKKENMMTMMNLRKKARNRVLTPGPGQHDVVQQQATPTPRTASSTTGKPPATPTAQPVMSTAGKPPAIPVAQPAMSTAGKTPVTQLATLIAGKPPVAPMIQPAMSTSGKPKATLTAGKPLATPVMSTAGKLPVTPATAVPQAVLEVLAKFANTITGTGRKIVVLNSSNAAKFMTQIGDVRLGGYPSHWHQITVKTPVPANERKLVISAINQTKSPLKITPYFFCMENKCITFLVNTWGAALKTLCMQDLKVPYTSDKFAEIELTIKPFIKSFNISEVLKEVVSSRLDSQKKFLDLSYINDIPEVQQMLFHPSDNWHILDQLLRTAHATAPQVAVLRLAGNGIVMPKCLWIFLSHCKWMSLHTLDLSDNEIESIDTVSLSRPLQIKELYLDRNPICKDKFRALYIHVIKTMFPCLTKLDGTYLRNTTCLPYWLYWKPNFIVDGVSNSGEFADQFVEHFFTLYDDGDRTKLYGLYHHNACFSFDCQLSTYDPRWTALMAETRNLFLKKRAKLTCGSDNIIERLWNLPDTQHDPYTFAVDLMVHTPKLTVLTVTGVFRNFADEEESLYKHFSRTFVLRGWERGEYQITNDMLFISSATAPESEAAFMFVRPPEKIMEIQPKCNLSQCEKQTMVARVQKVTNMSDAWSQKCLEDNDWDLKKALRAFVELYEMGDIPESAFVKSK